MKNKNWFFIISVLFICSCNSDCDDCGPTGYEEFYIKNTRDTSVNVKWFGFRTFASNLAHEINIASNERILLYRGDQMGESGAIELPPFNDTEWVFDSVKFEFLEQSFVFVKGDCDDAQNPLCEENHELIKNIDTKDQKIKEWLFTIE
jgi:hypothetical protein